MTRLRTIFTLTLGALFLPGALHAQMQPAWEIQPLHESGGVESEIPPGHLILTNGVLVKYGGAILIAERVSLDLQSGDAVADGRVRIQRDEQIWASEHLRYNFLTRQIEAGEFRTGKTPVFAGGEGLHGDVTNRFYAATNAFVTTDDVATPPIKVRAKYLKIIPGEKIEARQAVLYLEGVPVFYFPYYSRSLKAEGNHLNFLPGYRSSFGPFVLARYTWFLSDELDGTLHVDYRQRRGPGVGPDVNYHLGPWGEGTFKYYYLHDDNPQLDQPLAPVPENRQRVYFSYQANPATNLSLKSLVRYQSDIAFTRDFFEGEYRQNPQPNTFVEADKFWDNFRLDAYVQPRVNDFLQTVERLPDLRLNGYRQQVGASPLYYESQSSAGYYRFLFAETNGPPPGLNYEAARADTYHQVVLPETLFGWLNVTPRVGGRLTYYSQATGPGATTDEETRGVFNTGAEVSFKASRVWPGAQSQLLDLDGLRHILEPSVNYVYVPRPNVLTNQLPQFDSELPSLPLLPIEFPDYNAIDSIDSQNVLRLGLRNTFHTKRLGEVASLADWQLYTDWRLHPRANQPTFSDVYSDLTFKPRKWLTLESLLRYDVEGGQWRMAFHTLTLQPNDVWAWTIGHFYLRDDLSQTPTALGQGNNLFTSTLYYRLNENWGFRAAHRFEARDGVLEEQSYTVYRDLRSWTAALTFRVLDNRTGPQDYTVAFSFSLKAFPRFGLGSDIARPYSLLGG